MYEISLYEFEIPNTLVGLIIGVGGKTIMELCKRADVKMLIRPHHTESKQRTHQICSVEGKRENINLCLHMIKGRFPKERFPDLDLRPVLPPLINNQAFQFVDQYGQVCSAYWTPGHAMVKPTANESQGYFGKHEETI